MRQLQEWSPVQLRGTSHQLAARVLAKLQPNPASGCVWVEWGCQGQDWLLLLLLCAEWECVWEGWGVYRRA